MKLFMLFLVIILMIEFASAAPYSINFDVRNTVGFNDSTINANDIVAYIQARNPTSLMPNEVNMGQNFIDYGINNNVNPAFLIATAKLEGQFGTAGWTVAHPECHNTFGYGVPSGSTSPNSINCLSTWGDMISRVAYNIAYGAYYYKSGKYTVDQIRTVYAGQPNSQSIADIMNDIYNFAQSRHSTSASQSSLKQTNNVSSLKQTNNSSLCTPKTCLQLEKTCGEWDNGCQKSISCGRCSWWQNCNNGNCINRLVGYAKLFSSLRVTSIFFK
ncbi:MAG: hypothetical protein AABX11_06535 [Nanoarchaeota archaeon]